MLQPSLQNSIMLQPQSLGRRAFQVPIINLLPRRYASSSSSRSTVSKPIEQPTSPPTSSTTTLPPYMMTSTSAMRRKPVGPIRAAGMIQAYTPRTPGTRHLRRPINDHLWKGKPYRPLTFPKTGHGKGGRNRDGRVTCRHRGGGARRRIRTVDYIRAAPGPHTVERIEYDPNRSAHLALLTNNADGKKSYIIATEGLRAGDVVQSYRAGLPEELMASMGGVLDLGLLAAKTAFRGNCLPIYLVPIGTQVHVVGSKPNSGGVFCRSAGTFATVIAKEDGPKGGPGKHVIVKMQSGEIRKVSHEACATVGTVSNAHWRLRQLGKAGRSRWMNIRPHVRGVAMNAVDHPHGGGRGKSKGNKPPTSPWGTLAKSGYKTRRKRNPNRFMVSDRPRNQGKRRTKSKQ
jgi:ribosomal protein L2